MAVLSPPFCSFSRWRRCAAPRAGGAGIGLAPASHTALCVWKRGIYTLRVTFLLEVRPELKLVESLSTAPASVTYPAACTLQRTPGASQLAARLAARTGILEVGAAGSSTACRRRPTLVALAVPGDFLHEGLR